MLVVRSAKRLCAHQLTASGALKFSGSFPQNSRDRSTDHLKSLFLMLSLKSTKVIGMKLESTLSADDFFALQLEMNDAGSLWSG